MTIIAAVLIIALVLCAIVVYRNRQRDAADDADKNTPVTPVTPVNPVTPVTPVTPACLTQTRPDSDAVFGLNNSLPLVKCGQT